MLGSKMNRNVKGQFVKGHSLGKRFQEGHTPWLKGTKGVAQPNSGSFKRGSKVNLGHKHSEKTKQQISEKLMGNIPACKGTVGIMKPNKTSFKKGHLAPPTAFKKGNIPWNLGLKGDKSPCWKGGIGKKPYPFEFTRELKDLIRKRDNHKCQLCGAPQAEFTKKLPVHHIDYDKDNLNPENLITLCNQCNPKVNSKREYWTSYFQNKVRSQK